MDKTPRVVAPSGPVGDTAARRAAVRKSLWRLALHGIEPDLDPAVWRKKGYLAGPATARARSLVDALLSGTEVIWGVRGGFGSTRLLPAVEHMLASSPREQIFLGFSDLTALFPTLARKGFRCVHGPVLTQAGELVERGVPGFPGLLATLTGAPPRCLSFSTRDSVPLRSLSGPLWGGNLAMSASLCGTPYAPAYDGAILFLEDVGEPPYRLDRLITQLDLAGVFQAVQAVLVGDLGVRGSERGTIPHRLDMVRERWGIPIISGLPVGHGRRNACLEVGVPIQVAFHRGASGERNRVTLTWAGGPRT